MAANISEATLLKKRTEFSFKGITPINNKEMEVIKTIVGQHLLNLFTENVAFTIATFLEEEIFFQTLLAATRKGKKMKFLRYCKNLRYDAFGVYSYGTEVIELNWKLRTAKPLGRWCPTTSRHMNYAMHMLEICYDFKEIK